MTKIGFTSEQIAQKIKLMGDRVYADTIRLAKTDTVGLVYVANMAMGRPGDSSMSFGEVYDLAAFLMYQPKPT